MEKEIPAAVTECIRKLGFNTEMPTMYVGDIEDCKIYNYQRDPKIYGGKHIGWPVYIAYYEPTNEADILENISLILQAMKLHRNLIDNVSK